MKPPWAGVSLEMRHLQLVLALAEEGSAARAGERLCLTQSAVSHCLRSLEQRLGQVLFTRTRRGLVPTAAGERLIATARSVLGQIVRTEADLRDQMGRARRTLRVGTECSTSYHWLPTVLSALTQADPSVHIEICARPLTHPVPDLLAGRLDLALVQARLDSPRLCQEPLFQDELVALMPPSHRLAERSYLVASDFAEETLYLHSFPKENSLLFREVLLPSGVEPRQVRQVELTEAMLDLVKANLGVAVMARWAAQPSLQSGTLHAARITARGLRRHWWAATVEQMPYPDHLAEFSQAVRRHAPSLDAA